MTPRAPALKGLAIAALATAALSLIIGVTMATLVAPHFARMFDDLGGPLTPFTQLCIRPWFLVLVSSLPGAVAGAGLAVLPPGPGRSTSFIVAMALAVMLPIAMIVGLYLPIFSIAGSVHE